MRIVWDETKRDANLEKHGLDFEAFEDGFSWDRYLDQPARPSRTGRLRVLLLGTLDGRVVAAVVSPLGSEALSLVSLRVADAQERRLHDEAD